MERKNISPPRGINLSKGKNFLPLLMLLLLLAATFANFAHYALSMVSYPFEWDSFEGYHVYQSWRFARGEPLYKDQDVYPLLISNYPPVFFVLGGALLKVFGLAFWPVRLLSLAAGLTSGLMIFLIVKGESSSSFWALAGALLFFASPLSASYYLPMARVDSLALAFSLIALYLLRRGLDSKWALVGAGVFFLLAVYTKQTAVLAAIAGWLWLLLNKPRRALIMGIAMSAAGVSAFVLINRASAGEFFRQLFVLNVGRSAPGQAERMFIGFLGRWGIFFAVAVAALFAGRREQGLWRFFFVSSLLNGLFALRHGAVIAYYLPIVAAMVILCAVSTHRLDRFLSENGWVPRGRWGLATVSALGLIAVNGYQYVRPTPAATQKMEEYLRAFSPADGEILTFQMHSLAFLNGQQVFIFPTSLESTTAYRGLESSPFFGDIERGRFNIILDSYRYSFISQGIRDHLQRRYEPAAVIVLPVHRPGGEEFIVWRLRPEEAEGK